MNWAPTNPEPAYNNTLCSLSFLPVRCFPVFVFTAKVEEAKSIVVPYHIMIYRTPSKSNLAFPTDMKIGLITFSQKLLLNSCFQQLENTKFNPHFSPTQNTQPTYTHTSTITA